MHKISCFFFVCLFLFVCGLQDLSCTKRAIYEATIKKFKLFSGLDGALVTEDICAHASVDFKFLQTTNLRTLYMYTCWHLAHWHDNICIREVELTGPPFSFTSLSLSLSHIHPRLQRYENWMLCSCQAWVQGRGTGQRGRQNRWLAGAPRIPMPLRESE